MRSALRVLGVLLMLVGIYVVFFRESAGSLTSTVLPSAIQAGAVGGDSGVATGVQSATADGDSEAGSSTAETAPPPPTATVTITGPLEAGAAGSTSRAEPVAETITWDADDCDLAFKGYGVEMKPWGEVLLPYAVGFPTSEPGDIPDCAPNSDFGGAVVAAHLAYLDAMRPDLIPLFAAEGPGRDRRLADHPGPLDPDTLGYVCEPLGWQTSADGAFLIFHYCGESTTKVTEVPLTTAGGRWQLLYPNDGLLASEPADAGESYYPFAGGE